MLLHTPSTPVPPGAAQRMNNADPEDLGSARALVRKVMAESLSKLQREATTMSESIRWELGACWVQHLQNACKTESKKSEEAKVEPAVKGLGKRGGLLKEIKKKLENKGGCTEQKKEDGIDYLEAKKSVDISEQEKLEKLEKEQETKWMKLLPEAAYMRLKESETGLHLKVSSAFIFMLTYYSADPLFLLVI